MLCGTRTVILISFCIAQALFILGPSQLHAADPTLTVLPFHAVDAEGDPLHGRIVLVAGSTQRLYTWDMGNAALQECALPASPTCVSVSPDGTTAVVGHNKIISIVDLGSMTRIASWSCSINIADIVHGGNGYAYAFPGGSSVIFSVHLIDGVETPQSGYSVPPGMSGRLRPGNAALYEITDTWPDYIAHQSVANGPVQFQKQSLFGGYGGNLWFNDQGTLILSSSGKLCLTSDGADDLGYVGHLPASTGSIVWADHGGSGSGWFAAIPSAADSRIDLVNASLDDVVVSKSIPGFSGGSVPAHGRWVFLSQDGNTAYVVAEASASAALSEDQGIATIDLTPQPDITITSPATGSTLGPGFPLTFRVTEWPPPVGGSVAWTLDGADQGAATEPILVSGLPVGDHTIRVELRDQFDAAIGVDDSITIHVLAAQADVCRLTTDVVDAEGDSVHDRVILVSASPPRVHRWDASTGQLTGCNLPTAPTCVSVSPDGTTAVVGHDSRVTLVDLEVMTQIASWTSTANIFDIVHGGNGYAYALPRTGGSIHCIDLATGGDTSASSSTMLYSGFSGRLRPGTTALYDASDGISPSYVELYDISANPAIYRRSSVGSFPWGGNIWFNRPGTRIIARSGNVFQASGDAYVDMTYVGHLPTDTGNVVWVDHGGDGSGRYAAIPAADDTRIDLVNADMLDAAGSKALPAFASQAGPVPAHGRWVFLSQDGNTAHVVTQASAGAGLINDQGIATIDLTPQPGITITSPASDATLGSSFTVTYRTTAWPPVAGGSVAWTLDGVDQGVATGTIQLSGLATGDHAIQLELRDQFGAATGVADSIAVHILADQPNLLRLTTDVVDAEGDSEHGRVILVSASPPRIHRWDAATQVLTGCDLPAVPTCVSVSPDGMTAVVGHDSRVTLVNLGTMVQIATWTCAMDIGDIVHGGGGYAYLFPRTGAWGSIHRFDLATGIENTNYGNYVYGGSHARLCPGRPFLYDVTNGLTPNRLSCFDVDAGAAQCLRSSPNPGVHPSGGDLWFNRQGTRIITGSGNLFQASGDAAVDMAYAGRLPVATGAVVSVDHGGGGAGWYAAIPVSGDTRIDLVNADILDAAGSHGIPTFSSPDGPVPAHGRWVFLSQDGNTAYVVVQASADGGPINNQGIATINLTPQPGITITSPASDATLGSSFTVTYRTTAWPPLGGGSVTWMLDGVDQGVANGAIQITGLATGDHTIVVGLRDQFGTATGVADSIAIHVQARSPGFYGLATDVIDAEGDPLHGRVILVSASPPRIHCWNAATQVMTSCDLAAVPTCVSVSPDGNSAAIGHSGSVTLVDLASMSQIASWPCASGIVDVVHGGNGFAYVLPRTPSQVQDINLATGASSTTMSQLDAWWRLGRLRPGTARLYLAETGSSPDNLECFDIASSPAQRLRLSPYWGTYPFGGNLWFNDQGTRIISSSGNIYQADDAVGADMVYVGHLPAATGSVVWADHGGSGSGWFAAIPASERTRIDLINVDFLDRADSRSIPAFSVRGGPVPALGRWVFLSQDGYTAHVVVQADAGLIAEFGIATIDLRPTPSLDITSPAPGATLGSAFPVTYRTTAWPPSAGGSVVWSLDGVDQGSAADPLRLSGLAIGDHVIRLELRDHLGIPVDVADSITCHVIADEPGVFRLPCDVVDAENDPAHGRIVLVSASPPRLNIWDTATQELSGCDLSAVPTCISVSPDGTSAVVGHADRVSLVDLGSMTPISVWPRNTAIIDVVHAGNGRAYILPGGAQWSSLRVLDLATGDEVDATGASLYPGALGRLRPETNGLYLATGHLVPERIQRYDIAVDPAQYVRQSPYWGTHPIGGNLWFNDQGTRLVAPSGNVFAADDAPTVDLTYLGHLPTYTGSVVWVDHGGGGSGMFAAIPATRDTRIDLIGADALDYAGSRLIPALASIDGPVPAHGRWVFVSQDGASAYVIAKASAGSGLLNDQAIVAIDLTPQPIITITAPANGSTFGSDFEVAFTSTAWPPVGGGSIIWMLDGADQGIAANPIRLSGLPSGDHTIRIELRDLNGVATGVADSIGVHMLDPQPNILRLDTDIVDAEGDPAHGRVILVGVTPPRLYRWDSTTNALATCDLAAAPTCVSVSPDGASAVVGQDGCVSIVDLNAMTLTASWLCATDILDIVHGGNGYAYVFPRTDQWVSIHCIDLASGIDTPSVGSTYAGTLGRMRPGSSALYQADNGLMPDQVDHYDISLGTARFQRDCPYWYTYQYGGNLWFNDLGSKFLARSGNIFYASDDAATDMRYVGKLPGGVDRVIWADHAGSDSGAFALIPAAADGRIDLVDADALDLAGTFNLPAISVFGGTVPAHGRWVFLSSDGCTAYGIVRATTNLHAIVTVSMRTPPGAPTIGLATAGDTQATVAFTPPINAGGSPITGYNVTSAPGGITVSGAASPITVTGLTNGTQYTFSVTATNSIGASLASGQSNAVTPSCVVLSYEANGGVGTIADAVKTHNVPLTISDGSGFGRVGYSFAGWNTVADGSGTAYAGGSSYAAEVAVRFYAQWALNTYTVTYDANGGDGVISAESKIHGIPLTLSDGGGFSRVGYSFSAWNTVADGSGTAYAAGAYYTTNVAATLYAIWQTSGGGSSGSSGGGGGDGGGDGGGCGAGAVGGLLLAFLGFSLCRRRTD